jgi:glycosyltransferase involved in cell wall biosynthesis
MSQNPRSDTPLVSVVMATYNGEKFLRPAIASILDQTFRDFELIVVDDASTDRTESILRDFKDDRMVVLRNHRNLGIAGATNRGLNAARGQYIALQDHDDISLPHRFQTQVEFLNSHPDIAVVGSAATLIDHDDVAYASFPLPCDDIDLKWRLLFVGDAFHYTSIMARRSAIVEIGGYNEDPAFRFSEVYDPFSLIAMRHRVVNLPEILVFWRRHRRATSIQHAQAQAQSGEAISFRNVCLLADLEGGNSDNPALENERRYRAYAGFKAFTSTPAGQFPSLPGAQVVSGLRFFCELQRLFYRAHNFSSLAAARHRKLLDWRWGKHALALAGRAPWGWRSRWAMFLLGAQCLGRAAWAAILSSMASPSDSIAQQSRYPWGYITPMPYSHPERAAWTDRR